MKKVLVFTSNRADFSKLNNIIKQVVKHKELELKLIACGSHLVYESGYSIQQVDELFNVDYKIHSVVNGNDHVCMCLSTAVLINSLSTILNTDKPDIAVIHGDRTEAFTFATVCSLMNVKILHIEGGELSGTIDGKLRHCISILADIHCVSNETAKGNLMNMGISEEKIFVTGCPSYDNILTIGITNEKDDMAVLNRLSCKENSIIIAYHPDTLYMEDNKKFASFLVETIQEHPNLFFIIILPNLDAGNKDIIHRFRALEKETSVTNYKRMTHIAIEDYVVLLRNSRMMIGNSSTVVRETCLFGIPTINIGKRQLNRQHGKNVFSLPNANYKKFCELFEKVLQMKMFEPEYVYGCKDTFASTEIVKIMSKH